MSILLFEPFKKNRQLPVHLYFQTKDRVIFCSFLNISLDYLVISQSFPCSAKGGKGVKELSEFIEIRGKDLISLSTLFQIPKVMLIKDQNFIFLESKCGTYCSGSESSPTFPSVNVKSVETQNTNSGSLTLNF